MVGRWGFVITQLAGAEKFVSNEVTSCLQLAALASAAWPGTLSLEVGYWLGLDFHSPLFQK